MQDPPSHDPAKTDAPTPQHHALLCPHCKAVYDTTLDLDGKRVKCRVCGFVWRADSHAAQKISGALHDVVNSMSQLGSTLLAAADHASTVGHIVAETGRESRAPASEWVGRRVGRYEIKAVIGQGAMGNVYEALDVELKRPVALKLLPTREDQRESIGQKLFIQEGRIAARLQHPNIVTVFDVGEADGVYYLAMEIIRGLTLMALVKHRGPMPVEQGCYVMAHAARAVAAGHAVGVVHRDVKPGNILVDESGQVKLTDFGLAEVAGAEEFADLKGMALGTPGWISPEVARGEKATPASDIYGLGLTLYYVLTAKRIIKAKTKSGMIKLQRDAGNVPIERMPEEWPATLKEIVARCLAADPAERYQSAERLAMDLIRVASLMAASNGDVEIAKTIDVGPMGPGIRRWLIILLAVVAIGAALYFGIFHRK